MNIFLFFSIALPSAFQPACLSSIPFGRVYLWCCMFVVRLGSPCNITCRCIRESWRNNATTHVQMRAGPTQSGRLIAMDIARSVPLRPPTACGYSAKL
ncbi:hypothetical protein JB92DRAFT_2961849 [Gautieria morchelliformis]|nr:hypothetical protein JB92DRAFT_3012402 [Gautieria morchelliformis]KAF8506426.1 hypothetical protein JB92DRAFT_2961849 [Gautieria morchelliformis]